MHSKEEYITGLEDILILGGIWMVLLVFLLGEFFYEAVFPYLKFEDVYAALDLAVSVMGNLNGRLFCFWYPHDTGALFCLSR